MIDQLRWGVSDDGDEGKLRWVVDEDNDRLGHFDKLKIYWTWMDRLNREQRKSISRGHGLKHVAKDYIDICAANRSTRRLILFFFFFFC